MQSNDMARARAGLLIVLTLSLIAKHASAQNDAGRNPQSHSFIGSEWLQPLLHPKAPAANCTVQPSEVVEGDPVTATVQANHFNRRHALTYVWHPSDEDKGKVLGTGATTEIETEDAAPGSYTVTAYVGDLTKKKEPEAVCIASFTVKPRLKTPPVIEAIVETPPAPAPTPAVIAESVSVLMPETVPALRSIYFPTAMPSVSSPEDGLVDSQRETLLALATDFKKYLERKPEARLILEGHTDPRGRAEYNQKLCERRVERVKRFLVEQGISEANIDTRALGTRDILRDAEVKEAVRNNVDLSRAERRRALRNMQPIVLASDRRVDITLSTTGDSSVRQFPLDAADASMLIGVREGEARQVARTTAKKNTSPPTNQPANQSWFGFREARIIH